MDYRQIAAKLQNVELTFPFNEETHVYKVEGKMFMLTDPFVKTVSLKNTPDKNYFLRTSYDYIKVGYHLNKEHWITIELDGSEDQDLVASLIVESYSAVIAKLPKKTRLKYSDYL